MFLLAQVFKRLEYFLQILFFKESNLFDPILGS